MAAEGEIGAHPRDPPIVGKVVGVFHCQQGGRQVAIDVQVHPGQGGKHRFSVFGKTRNGLCGTTHQFSGHGWRHVSVEGLRHGEMGQVYFGLNERGIDFSGAQDKLQAILLAVPLHRLPLMAAAKEDGVSFAPRKRVCVPIRRLRGRGDGQGTR